MVLDNTMRPGGSPLPQNSLEGLLVQHKTFLTQAQSCILTDISANQHNGQYKEFLSILSQRIKSHKARLGAVEQGQSAADGEDGIQWGPIEATRLSQNDTKIVLKIHGPASTDEHIVEVKEEEAFKLVCCWPQVPLLLFFFLKNMTQLH